MTLDEVYEVVEMKVGYVMRDYITHCTDQRQLAENDIKEAKLTENNELLVDAKARKSFWKLMANSSFGKTMQSDERFGNSHLVRNIEQFYKATLGKVMTDSCIISQDLVEVRTRKHRPLIKSPKYLASAILSNSKMLMLDFVYNCLWKTFSKDEAKILYTDTDSLYLQIINIESYDQFLEKFPTDLKKMHFAGPSDLTVGKMKLEKVIKEAVFLKPKTYALLDLHNKEEPHNKGVKIFQNKEQHMLSRYKEVLFNENVQSCTNTNIKRTEKFGGLQMNTLKQVKVGLDFWEDKRYWLNQRTSVYSIWIKQ